MCGIAGQRYREPVSPGKLQRAGLAMGEALHHRGPDMSGIWVEPSGRGVLSFARLAIQDLSPAANQPMHSESGRFVIVYNGEIYNADDLCALIGRDPKSFRTHSDTDVLLACIEKLGLEPTLGAANAMFAFALWDSATGSVYLCRDRLGKKPLHYCVDAKSVCFASEIKALLRVQDCSRALSPDALEAYFTLTYIPAPHSIFASIRKVKPGNILEIKPDLTLRERSYWSLRRVIGDSRREKKFSFPRAIKHTSELLKDAVRRRLVSDVPVAVLLSGGVDSSLVAYMLARELKANIQCFSIGVEDQQLDESSEAQAIAGAIGIPTTVLRLSRSDALGLVDEVFSSLDEPFGDSSSIPTYAICKLARGGATVLLTGDGGDEVFGGYTRYIWTVGLRSLAARTYAVMRRQNPLVGNSKVALEVYRRLMTLGDDYGARAETIDRLAGGLSRLPSLSLLQYLRYLDFQLYLPDDILVKTDRMSMASSTELRSPFLDYRLVEFSWLLRDSALVNGDARKRITTELFRQRIGAQFLQRKKHGFALPFGQWLVGPLKDEVETALAELGKRGDLTISAEHMRRSWSALLAGDDRSSWPVWLLFAFWRWSNNWEKRAFRAAE